MELVQIGSVGGKCLNLIIAIITEYFYQYLGRVHRNAKIVITQISVA